MISAAALIGLVMWYVMTRTRIGKSSEAAAHNPSPTAHRDG